MPQRSAEASGPFPRRLTPHRAVRRRGSEQGNDPSTVGHLQTAESEERDGRETEVAAASTPARNGPNEPLLNSCLLELLELIQSPLPSQVPQLPKTFPRSSERPRLQTALQDAGCGYNEQTDSVQLGIQHRPEIAPPQAPVQQIRITAHNAAPSSALLVCTCGQLRHSACHL